MSVVDEMNVPSERNLRLDVAARGYVAISKPISVVAGPEEVIGMNLEPLH